MCFCGLMSCVDVDVIEWVICFGEGVCGGMYIVNIMVSVVEVFGMLLLGSVVLLVIDCWCDGFVCCSG